MKVLVTATNYSKYCQPGKKLLEEAGCEIIENPHGRPYTFEELKEIVGDIDGVVVGVDTWNEEVFRLAPKLKVLARFGVGVDNIDLKAAEKREIVVCNSPGINSSAGCSIDPFFNETDSADEQCSERWKMASPDVS